MILGWIQIHDLTQKTQITPYFDHHLAEKIKKYPLKIVESFSRNLFFPNQTSELGWSKTSKIYPSTLPRNLRVVQGLPSKTLDLRHLFEASSSKFEDFNSYPCEASEQFFRGSLCFQATFKAI